MRNPPLDDCWILTAASRHYRSGSARLATAEASEACVVITGSATILHPLLHQLQGLDCPQEAQATAPDAMSVLSSMLDQNKDGSSMDDLQRMAANFFK